MEAVISIRAARPSDLHEVLALLTSALLPVEGVADGIGDGWSVAVDADRIVGVEGLEIHGEDGLLRSAAVHGAWRGRGIGEALTRDRIDWARSRGLRGLYLLTETAPEFFARFGFTRIERADVPEPVRNSAEFTTVCPASATVMRLALDERRPGDLDGAMAESVRGDHTSGEPDHGADEPSDAALREVVRLKYGEAAKRAARGGQASCCGPSCCGEPALQFASHGSDNDASASRANDQHHAGTHVNPITGDLYDGAETSGLPEAALLASLGCGNPTALAELRQGEVVLDLGSGGGIDVLLSARRVGPTGHVYGLDMTDEMLALARENQRLAGVHNVEFLKGEIENIPLPDASVDVIISNCVINLSADKARVLREAHRVLRPGGRFAVSDIVIRGAMPAAIRVSMGAWTGCIAGALEEAEYRDLLERAGFEAIEIEPTRIYTAEHARALLEGTGIDPRVAEEVDGRFMSAFVRARKPASIPAPHTVSR